jgi:hypothetical protein
MIDEVPRLLPTSREKLDAAQTLNGRSFSDVPKLHGCTVHGKSLWVLVLGLLPHLVGAERARRLESDKVPIVIGGVAGVLVASTVVFCTFIHAYYQLYTKHESDTNPDEEKGEHAADNDKDHPGPSPRGDPHSYENQTVIFGPGFEIRTSRKKECDRVRDENTDGAPVPKEEANKTSAPTMRTVREETDEEFTGNMWSVERYSDEALKDGVPKDRYYRLSTSPGADLQDIITTAHETVTNIEAARMQGARSADLDSVSSLKGIGCSAWGCCAKKV